MLDRLGQFRALESPLRQEIVDSLQALGQASVGEIARSLAAPADGLYYHLRALERAGLVRRAGSRSKPRGRPEAVYRAIGRRHGLRLRYTSGKGEESKALSRVVTSMLRTAGRDFARGLSRGDVVLEGGRRELWASREKCWLTPAGLARANELLNELADLWRGRPRRDAKPYSLTFLLAPATLRRRK